MKLKNADTTVVEEPVGAAEFAAAMAAFAPYESAPRLAVACSGGADSMALLLLTRDWVRAHRGKLVALTVDHGLRKASGAEAKRVGAWARRHGIVHKILKWRGSHPRGDIQAAARAARYRLLEEFCAAKGILHLLLAHQRDDQAETLLLRLARGSGLDGLAAMSPLVERPDCRILRPLLGVAPERLRATLRARKQDWIDDPSNENPAFARARLRKSQDILAREGLTTERLASTTHRLARARYALEGAVADLLAKAATPHPHGFVSVDTGALLAAPEELGLRALAAIVAAVGGEEFPPRLEKLERLYRELHAGTPKGRTLGGCRFMPRRTGLLVCREAAAVAPPVRLQARTVWDGRFRLALAAKSRKRATLGALGEERVDSAVEPPAAIRATLPTIRDRRGVLAVPGLNYVRNGTAKDCVAFKAILLRSTRPATGAGVKVV